MNAKLPVLFILPMILSFCPEETLPGISIKEAGNER